MPIDLMKTRSNARRPLFSVSGRPDVKPAIKYYNQPLASYEESITLGTCWQLLNFADKFEQFELFMRRKLQHTEDFKIQMEYIFPLRRYMAMTTVFSTSLLAGYSTMPRVLRGTKTSLASIFALMENRNDFGSRLA